MSCITAKTGDYRSITDNWWITEYGKCKCIGIALGILGCSDWQSNACDGAKSDQIITSICSFKQRVLVENFSCKLQHKYTNFDCKSQPKNFDGDFVET